MILTDHEAYKTEEDARSVFKVKYASMNIIELILSDL
jgi:hypothetical protein